MEDFRERTSRRPIQRKLRRVSIYAVIMTVFTLIVTVFLVMVGLAYRSALKTLEEQDAVLSEITSENKSMSESIQELENTNESLSSSNEKMEEDLDFFSKIMSENQLRLEIIDLFEAKNSTYNVLKKIYPDKLVLLDSGQFNFFDINRDLNKCEYTKEYFIYDEESREMSYAPDGKDISVKGIDISKYNGEVNWEKVADSGVKFAYVRAGVRGYVSGEIVKDDTFDDNIEKAKQAVLQPVEYVRDKLGYEMKTYRPPYGARNYKMEEVIGMIAVLWTLDTRDWSNRDEKITYNKAMDNVEDGDIILMHSLYPSTAKASERLIPDLMDRGFQLVSVSELLYYKGIDVDGLKAYGSN